MNKKPAFTMVELIFVIVVLGILAAVAVPKLNASRENAQTATILANMRTAYNDVLTYYAARGEIPDQVDFSQLTNVPLIKSASSARTYSYCLDSSCANESECFRFYSYADDCVAVFYNSKSLPACQNAVQKMDFLVGDDKYASAQKVCDASQMKNIKAIKDATDSTDANTLGWRGVILPLGGSGIEQ